MGYNNIVDGSHCVVTGYTNTVPSNYCSVFGNTNTLGSTYATPYSLVAGGNNTVDGSSGAVGYNCVVGYSCTVAHDYNAVFGDTNTVNCEGCGVFGSNNTVAGTFDSLYSLVAGESNTVDGVIGSAGYNCVVGYSCDVDGGYNAVFGNANTCASYYGLIGGVASYLYVNSKNSIAWGEDVRVGFTTGAPGTLAVGKNIDSTGYFNSKGGEYFGYGCLVGNTLVASGAYSYLFGTNLTLTGATYEYTMVCGSGVTVGATNSSSWSAVFGKNHNVDGFGGQGYNLVAGDSQNVDAAYSCTMGAYNTTGGNFVFAHGDTCTVSQDYALARGDHCVASAKYGAATGYATVARWWGQKVHSGFTPTTSTPGESQNTLVLSASCEHIGSPAVWRQLWPDGDGGSASLGMVVDTTYYFHFLVVARKKGQAGTPQTKTWYGRFAVQRDSGASTLVGSSVTADFSTSAGDEASWDFQISVVSDAIVFEGKGSADGTNPTHFQLHVYGPEVCTAN